MSKNMEPKVRFITVTRAKNKRRRRQAATTTRAKGRGGPFVGRLLQDAEEEEEENANDLVVTFPQAFEWEEGGDNTTEEEDEVYPMILSSNTTWEVDACLLLPPGHVLVAVLDADSDQPVPLEGECTQVVVPGEETVLLFQLGEETVPWTRALYKRLKQKKKKCDDVKDFHGHIEAVEKKKSKKKKKKKKKGEKVILDIVSAVKGKAGKSCKEK